ncbi:type II toxin-antitoxin system prevent-host-death family antitoxin [Microbacterium protaetiae]|uniref:Antitoxin n=1 Tax=Microbacterium protaetiae TaxID=2509458 RepID=A0A4P6ECS8_9MICO|nr:type II toxin-antitoxin system prevent-host-death family antitoxin [Microbacterium protaetiae]QAY59446.1 type II toxin-antitoxin system prevent-host-death family antitoxin [Microbacterium protaetiae]
MSRVSAYDAKTHLSALLERAAAGESITITKHGHDVARLTPVDARPDPAGLIEKVRGFRASLPQELIDIRELIDDGRRY